MQAFQNSTWLLYTKGSAEGRVTTGTEGARLHHRHLRSVPHLTAAHHAAPAQHPARSTPPGQALLISTLLHSTRAPRLTPDRMTSPDSVSAASLESTTRTELFISTSSSSLQSGLLAPTAEKAQPSAERNTGSKLKTCFVHRKAKRTWTGGNVA